MKKIILITCLLFVFSSTYAQTSDYSLVEQTVNYYMEGGTNNDYETLKKAFHPTATMKYIRNGEYTEVNALEFFKKGMDPSRPKSNRKTRVVNINVTGHAANAVLEIEYPNFFFIDYMNLLKVDGEWKVVNKIFYRKAKE